VCACRVPAEAGGARQNPSNFWMGVLAGGGQALPPAPPGGGLGVGLAKPALVATRALAVHAVGMAGVANINDVLDGHVALEIECVDRLLLNAYVPGF
jgi:hypothetical protein